MVIMVLAVAVAMAQAPEKFTYQAVVRNANNALVANAQVGVRVNILQGSATGNAVYSESHVTSSNANGLITVNIGDGYVLHGSFAGIDWSDGPYFLKTDIDPNGGNDYSITSTQQLLSVPYALYAKEAGNSFSGDYNDLTNTPTIPTVPTNVSAFTNDAGYLTDYTEQQVLSISNDTLFLTGGSYVKLPAGFDGDYNSLTNKPTIPTVPTNVSAFTNDAGYITGTDIPEIPTVPTNVSAFTNDAGYLTEYTEQQVLSISNDTLFLTGGSFVKLPAGFDGDYNSLTNKPTIPTVPTNVSAFTNDAGYITGTDIPAIPTVPTNVSSFTNDAGYLTEYTEQQVLSISNDTLFLTGGSYVKLPAGFDGDYNSLTNKPTIPTVPTNVSAFTNDAGYITGTDIPAIPTVPTNVSAFTNDAGYLITYTETDPQFNAWDKDYNDLTNKPVLFDGNYNSLSNKPVLFDGDYNSLTNQPTIPTVPTNVSSFTNDAGYITKDSVPTNVSAFANDAGYLTEAACNGVAICEMLNTLAELQNQVDSLQQSSVTSEAQGMTPTVTTAAVSDIAATSATCGGEVTSDGGSVVVAKGVCWNTTGAPTISDSHTIDGGGMGPFLSDLQALTPGTIYFVRAYATNSMGTTYGEEITYATTFTCGYNLIDGINTYTTQQYGIQCWMTQNLRDVTDILQPCPSGWHLPNNDEWNALGTHLPSSPVNFGNGHYLCAMPWQQYTLFADFCVQSNNVTFTGSACEAHDYASGNCIPNYYPLSVRCVRDENGVVVTAQAPAVTTATVSDIASTSVTCGGEVTSDSGSVVIAKGVCWNTTGTPTISGNHTIDGGGTGFFVSNLQALTPGTTYFVRAYATSGAGTAYGEEITFTTAAEETLEQGMTPTVTTAAVSDIAATSATCGGEVTSDGESVVMAKGVCWNTTGTPTISGNHTISGGGTGGFVSDLQALTPSTTYFVRAYATNNTGTAYGEEITFTTAAEETVEQGMTPTVTTAAVSDIAATSATCGGEVTSDSGSVVIAKGVCWNTTGIPTVSGNHTIDGGGTGFFVSNLQALSPGTTYFVRAYATNNTGTAYGEEITFTTAAEETVEQGMTPTVTTAAVSDDGGGTGAFLSDLQPLTSGMTYFVRAYATNSAGTAYGEEVPFMITFTCGGNLVDGSDSYTTSAYGSQCWMTQNLRKANGSELFSWVDASHSCPAGWHLPTAAEWDVLANYVNTNSAQDTNIPLFFAHIGSEYWVDMTMPWQDMEGNPHTLSEPCCINGQHINSICGIGYEIDQAAIVNVRCVRDMEEERALPTVTTAAVSDIAATSATCGGEVTSDGGDGGGTGAFLSDLQPLTSGMTYFVRAYATNSAGTAYGEEVTFMMAFTCGSNLIDGNNSYTTSAYGSQCWMTQNLRKANGSELFSWVEASHSCPAGWHLPTAAEWDVLANYVNTNSAQDSNIPLFFAHIGSEYWVDMTMPYQTPDGSQYTVSALCCINGQQINSNCGIAAEINIPSSPVRCVREVEVDQVLPTVMTTAVPNITATSVTCGGEVISDGGSVVTAKGVCWNTTGFPTISDNHTIAGGGIGPFFSELQGLILGKTYYLRSYAINSTGISYGLQVSFTVTGYDYQTWDGAGPNPNDALPCQGAATVTDHEGNVYNTVQIGNQCWTRENMRCTTSPSTGTTILEYPASSYSYTGKKAYYVNGSAENSSTYGLLYNWNAAMDTFNTVYGETSTDTNYNHTVDVTFSDSRRGICPSGWHVPNKAEWSQLNDYVESQNKELFTFSESNPTGFSVLLAGVYDQDYAEFGYNARFWTTAQSSPRKACSFWSVGFCCTTTKFVGVPVRCLRDY